MVRFNFQPGILDVARNACFRLGARSSNRSGTGAQSLSRRPSSKNPDGDRGAQPIGTGTWSRAPNRLQLHLSSSWSCVVYHRQRSRRFSWSLWRCAGNPIRKWPLSAQGPAVDRSGDVTLVGPAAAGSSFTGRHRVNDPSSPSAQRGEFGPRRGEPQMRPQYLRAADPTGTT